jgi:predicted component of viral defense system (DUF524 family)
VDGRRALHLFDLKYKLDGKTGEDGASDGRPKKDDIDKMHAYRDAIRDAAFNRVVQTATILYPGPDASYPTGVGALYAYPGDDHALIGHVREIVHEALHE